MRERVIDINRSGARILCVGLGCPKRERWMAQHRCSIKSVILRVGVDFDFLAGTKKQARLGAAERLGVAVPAVQAPRRLWKRYVIHNPRFAGLACAELLGLWRPGV